MGRMQRDEELLERPTRRSLSVPSTICVCHVFLWHCAANIVQFNSRIRQFVPGPLGTTIVEDLHDKSRLPEDHLLLYPWSETYHCIPDTYNLGDLLLRCAGALPVPQCHQRQRHRVFWNAGGFLDCNVSD